jgi:metal-responsive CopG/Arc/MetJ family transcriptional regulator
VRTLVNIPEDDIKALDELAKRQKTSRAQVIRTAVAEHLKGNPAKVDVSEFAGLWKDKGIDGLEFVRKLRSEW